MKRCSISYIIRDIQTKTKMRYHYIPVRMAKIPNADKDVEQQELSFTVGGNVKVQPLWKTVWWFLTKLNALLQYGSAIAFLGIYPKKLKTYIYTKTCTQMFIAALFIIDQTWKQPRCPQ